MARIPNEKLYRLRAAYRIGWDTVPSGLPEADVLGAVRATSHVVRRGWIELLRQEWRENRLTCIAISRRLRGDYDP